MSQLPGFDPIFSDNGISDALRQNAAVGAEKKPKFNFGQFLAAWAGHLGDSLTGNPVYGNALQSRAQGQAQEEERRRQQEWWYEQQRYQQANKAPDKPGIAEELEWFQSLPPEQRGPAAEYIRMRYPGSQSPQMIPHGYDEVPQQGGAAPTATGPNGEKIRFNPQSGAWEPMGGQAGQPSPGGFPGF